MSDCACGPQDPETLTQGRNVITTTDEGSVMQWAEVDGMPERIHIQTICPHDAQQLAADLMTNASLAMLERQL